MDFVKWYQFDQFILFLVIVIYHNYSFIVTSVFLLCSPTLFCSLKASEGL